MLEKLILGGFMMIPLVICSVLTLAVLIERTLVFRRNERIDLPSLRAQILDLVGQDRLDEAMTLCAVTPGPVTAVLLAGLRMYKRTRATKVSEETQRMLIQKAMDEFTPHALHVCELRLNWLATISNVAPLFGMTGTVTGMIRSFGSLSGAGTLDAGVVGAGISEALVATASGLIIALAALIPFNGFMNRVAKTNFQIGEAASELVEFISLREDSSARPADRA